MNYLYIYIKKGSPFDSQEQLFGKERIATRADYQELPSGDVVGKIVTMNGLTRLKLQNVAGITVLPPAHRPLQSQHITVFAQCDLKTPLAQGDTAYEFGEKLYETHAVEWMHPENWFLGGDASAVDATEIRLPDDENGPRLLTLPEAASSMVDAG